MKRYRGKKRLATIEKQAWQKKFLKAQDAILSRHAYRGYKELGPGMIWIELNNCMPDIMPGLNIPELEYDSELDPNYPGNKLYLERIKEYDPEKQYIVVFQSYQADPPFTLTWTRNLKLLSEEEFEKEYALKEAMFELSDQYELFEKGLIDSLPDRIEKHGVVIELPKSNDPTKH